MTTDPSAVGVAVSASSLAELSWVDTQGEPQVQGVVPLVRAGRPVVAFTYAEETMAWSVAGSGRPVALSITEPRSTGAAFRPLLVTGRARLVEDPEGDLYAAELLVQELRRYPPARVYADSPLLQRENWWYLPRLVVEIDVDDARPLAARTDPAVDHVLAVAGDTGLSVQTVRKVSDEGRHLDLRVGEPLPAGPAVVFGQDASFPDLENWAQWRYDGSWDGARFTVAHAPATEGLGPPAGLRQRLRRQRGLERACVAALTRVRRARFR